MVYKIAKNNDGDYVKDGQRYDLISCNICESKEVYATGEYEVIDGVQVPVMAERKVINKGWTEFANDEAAIAGFGLTYSPKEQEPEE